MPTGTETEITDEATGVDIEDQGGDEYDLFAELQSELNGDSSEDSDVSTDESEGSDDDKSDTFTVTVDGEELEVTLDELRDGYSRQADYTRKTQALAAERERLRGMEQLADALNADPKVALEELARAFGVDWDSPGESAELDSDLDDLDPLERTVKELQAEIAELKGEVTLTAEERRQAAEDRALQQEIDRIKQVNDDPNLDEEVLLRYAIDNKINDLEKAYKFMRLETGAATRDEGNEQLEAKRNAPHVENGPARKGAAKGSGKITSIVDAFAQTMNELNG